MKKLFIFVVFLISICATSTYSQDNNYSNSIGHFSVSIPTGWVEIQKELLDQSLENVEKQTSTKVAHYIAGFHKKDDRALNYPYFLINYKKTVPPSYDDIENNIIPGMKKDVENIAKKDEQHLGGISLNEPFLDKKKNAIFSEITGFSVGTDKIKGLSVMFLGNNSFTQFSFYSTETEYDKVLPEFQSIIDSFMHNPGYEYNPDVATSENSILSADFVKDGIVGTFTGAIMMFFASLFSGRQKKGAILKKTPTDKISFVDQKETAVISEQNKIPDQIPKRKVFKFSFLRKAKKINSNEYELEGHLYYRLFKVIFVGLYLLVIISAIIFIVNRYSPQSNFVRENSKIICIGGNNKTLSYNKFVDKNNILYYPKNLIDACDLRQGYRCVANPNYDPNFWNSVIGGSYEMAGDPNKSICSYEIDYDQIISAGIEKTYRIQKIGGLGYIIGFSLLAIIGISLCFEIVKRIFYYIVFGTHKIHG